MRRTNRQNIREKSDTYCVQCKWYCKKDIATRLEHLLHSKQPTNLVLIYKSLSNLSKPLSIFTTNFTRIFTSQKETIRTTGKLQWRWESCKHQHSKVPNCWDLPCLNILETSLFFNSKCNLMRERDQCVGYRLYSNVLSEMYMLIPKEFYSRQVYGTHLGPMVGSQFWNE